MFGYIKPLKPELKVKEFEKFKACYCSLCHTLGKEFGLSARFILNYDFVFLAMLLWDENEKPSYEMKCCVASPCRKKCVCRTTDSLKKSAGYSIILAYWKFKDSVADDSFFKSIAARLGILLLSRAYKKASRLYSEFDKTVKQNLAELSELERKNERSLDKAADKFALILSAAALSCGEDADSRVLYQLLYHTGRWIYIMDAVNDIKEDMESGRYNPVVARFNLTSDRLDADSEKALRSTAANSENLIISAFSLMPKNTWHSIIENIIYLGMSDVCENVFNGTYNNAEKQRLPK